MVWQLDKSKPICPQLCGILSGMIAAGDPAPGARLMSVREVAVAAGVNPNTVQKSFEELERQGLIRSVRGVGWFVCEDTAPAREAAETLKREKTRTYFNEMTALGISSAEVKAYVKEFDYE